MVVWWLYQSTGSSRLELWVWLAGWRSEGGEDEKGMRGGMREGGRKMRRALQKLSGLRIQP